MKPILAQALSDSKNDINAFLKSYFDKNIEEATKIDRHIATMASLLKTQSLGGGKRIRGFLCLLAYALAGGTKNATNVAAGIELVHQYLLTLDDMADRDVVRHGIPTLEVEYEKTLSSIPTHQRKHYARSFTEIACTLLSSYMYELFASAECSDAIKIEILHLVNNTLLRDTAAGWQIHMLQNWQSIAESSEDEFEKGLRLVTAQYTFVGPLLIGITLAGQRKEYEPALTTYGMHVGTAFQMHDDILGVFGESTKTGKAVGNDLREGKKTILLQYAYKHASKAQHDVMNAMIGNEVSSEELRQMQDIMRETGALQYAQERAKKHIALGIHALNTLPESTSKQLLIELAQYIIAREV